MEYQIAVNMNQTHMINIDKSQKQSFTKKNRDSSAHTYI